MRTLLLGAKCVVEGAEHLLGWTVVWRMQQSTSQHEEKVGQFLLVAEPPFTNAERINILAFILGIWHEAISLRLDFCDEAVELLQF